MAKSKNPAKTAAKTTTEGTIGAPCIRSGGSVAEIKQAILDNLVCIQGRFDPVASLNDYYLAVAYTVRDRILAKWARTAHVYYEKESRTVCYLSAEFLLGPHLENHLINLRLSGADRSGGGTGAGKRRPRKARCLLPRFDRHAQHPGHRLRDPV
jgi:hypothetical protein